MAFRPTPPTIPGSLNLKTSITDNVRIESLNVKNKLGLFGAEPNTQQFADMTVESIVALLQSYGLSPKNPFQQTDQTFDYPYRIGYSLSMSYDGNTFVTGIYI